MREVRHLHRCLIALPPRPPSASFCIALVLEEKEETSEVE